MTRAYNIVGLFVGIELLSVRLCSSDSKSPWPGQIVIRIAIVREAGCAVLGKQLKSMRPV